jgi:hypothetical protein
MVPTLATNLLPRLEGGGGDIASHEGAARRRGRFSGVHSPYNGIPEFTGRTRLQAKQKPHLQPGQKAERSRAETLTQPQAQGCWMRASPWMDREPETKAAVRPKKVGARGQRLHPPTTLWCGPFFVPSFGWSIRREPLQHLEKRHSLRFAHGSYPCFLWHGMQI